MRYEISARNGAAGMGGRGPGEGAGRRCRAGPEARARPGLGFPRSECPREAGTESVPLHTTRRIATSRWISTSVCRSRNRSRPEGNVRCIKTPAGEVASTVHTGPYDQLGNAHGAIHAWCAANNRKIGQASWEIYGDWTDDPARLETTIKYLLAEIRSTM